MKIAFLGTGRLGTELAKHVLKEHELVVWNRSIEKTEELKEAGAAVAETAEEAVDGADLVISCLFGPDAVRETIIEPGLIPAGVTWADASTVSPADAKEFEDKVETYVHTPVVGTLGPAREQKLGGYVGSANEDAREEAYGVVKTWGAENPERVKQVESGHRAAVGKLLANLALAVSAQGYKEALLFGESQGLGADEVSDMLESTGLAFIKNMKEAFVVGERDTDPGDFTVDAIAKDVGLILDSADSKLPTIQAALKSLKKQQSSDRGDHDFSAILVNREQ